MNLRVIALYPARVSSLAGQPGVRFRQHGARVTTLVPCTITSVEGVSMGVPDRRVPDDTPVPVFRAQVEMARKPVASRESVCVVLSGDRPATKMDPEQMVLSPIFDDGTRQIFEFRRAHLLIVSRRGDVELRLVVVQPATGAVGTRTIYRFDMRFSGLAIRCGEHLAGVIDLFPPKERPPRDRAVRVPAGEANIDIRPNGQMRVSDGTRTC